MSALRFSAALATEMVPPALPLLLREAGSFAAMRARASFAGAVASGVQGDGRPVLVLPGFLANDVATSRLRKSLNGAGFAAHGWGLGRNLGVKRDILDRIDARIEALELEQPVTLVGWSLGGILAREYAKMAPHRVAKVITLGSPFSGGMRANNAWRLYEWVAGHSVDAPPIEAEPHVKPPVPTIALWSRRDGVVAPGSACGGQGESDRHLELACTHMAFVSDPAAIRTICQVILADD